MQHAASASLILLALLAASLAFLGCASSPQKPCACQADATRAGVADVLWASMIRTDDDEQNLVSMQLVIERPGEPDPYRIAIERDDDRTWRWTGTVSVDGEQPVIRDGKVDNHRMTFIDFAIERIVEPREPDRRVAPTDEFFRVFGAEPTPPAGCIRVHGRASAAQLRQAALESAALRNYFEDAFATHKFYWVRNAFDIQWNVGSAIVIRGEKARAAWARASQDAEEEAKDTNDK